MKLSQDDKVQVYHAIAYVISAMPMDQAAQSLRTFALDIVAQVHTFTAKPTAPTKEEKQAINGKSCVFASACTSNGASRCHRKP